MISKTSHTIYNYCRTFLLAIIVLAAGVSCLKQTDNIKFENLIPEKDFESILYELHLTNGLLALPDLRTRYTIQDTSGLYIKIIEGYGYRTGQMDTTIQYFFIKKSKKLIRIYDRMLARFSEMQARIDKNYASAPANVIDQWKGSHSCFLPDTGNFENASFEIILATQGTYTLTFTVTLFPGDQTKDPGFMAWICDADSVNTGKKNYLSLPKYIKDGQPHYYAVTGTHTSMEKVVLKGSLYHYSSNPDFGAPETVIEDITFYYSGKVE